MQKKTTREAGKKKTQAAVNESYLQTVFRRFRKHRLALVSFIVLVALVGAALLAPSVPSAERRHCRTGLAQTRSEEMS